MTRFLLILAIVVACTTSYAQDILTTRTGEDILGKVIEVNATTIRYRKADALTTGPVYELAKSDLLMIRYENGTKNIFTGNDAAPQALTDAELYAKGKADAAQYYTGYKAAGTGTFITGLLSPLVGLIPAIACSATKPKDANLDYPDASLMKNSEYYRGYTQKAKKIKSGKVWKNWCITLGINFIATLALEAGH